MAFFGLFKTTLRIAVVAALMTGASGCRYFFNKKAKSDPSLVIVDDEFPRWCVPVNLLFKDELTVGAACGETKELCEKIKESAKKMGGLGGIQSVGDCFQLPKKEDDEE